MLVSFRCWHGIEGPSSAQWKQPGDGGGHTGGATSLQSMFYPIRCLFLILAVFPPPPLVYFSPHWRSSYSSYIFSTNILNLLCSQHIRNRWDVLQWKQFHINFSSFLRNNDVLKCIAFLIASLFAHCKTPKSFSLLQVPTPITSMDISVKRVRLKLLLLLTLTLTSIILLLPTSISSYAHVPPLIMISNSKPCMSALQPVWRGLSCIAVRLMGRPAPSAAWPETRTAPGTGHCAHGTRPTANAATADRTSGMATLCSSVWIRIWVVRVTYRNSLFVPFLLLCTSASWLVPVTSWSLVATVRFPGNRRRRDSRQSQHLVLY